MQGGDARLAAKNPRLGARAPLGAALKGNEHRRIGEGAERAVKIAEGEVVLGFDVVKFEKCSWTCTSRNRFAVWLSEKRYHVREQYDDANHTYLDPNDASRNASSSL